MNIFYIIGVVVVIIVAKPFAVMTPAATTVAFKQNFSVRC
jgi:hypothetical protein